MLKRFFKKGKKRNKKQHKEVKSSKSSPSVKPASTSSQTNSSSGGVVEDHLGKCAMCQRSFTFAHGLFVTTQTNRVGGICHKCGNTYCPEHVSWETVEDPITKGLSEKLGKEIPLGYSAVCPKCDILLNVPEKHEFQQQYRPWKY